jgi:hypothetical protein
MNSTKRTARLAGLLWLLSGALGALPTMLWLLIKGAKVQPLETRAS